MQADEAIIVIPARLRSSRLPGKVLADIHGHPMLWYVYQRSLRVKRAQAVYVATDSDEVRHAVEGWGGTVFMTSPDCPSGTARVASIVDRLDSDIIVNVQGDEPLVDPDIVDQIIETFDQVDAPVITAVYPIRDLERLRNTAIVKVVRAHTGYALYFSRSTVPFGGDGEMGRWLEQPHYWGIVNVYGFQRQTLVSYSELPESPLEDLERVEQLRFLEGGVPWYTIVSEKESLHVDTPEDLERMRDLIGALGERAANP